VLFKSTPDEVKFILVDPKRVELGAYQDIPHLLTPVVADAKQASEVLKWVVFEMEGRIRMLASEGVRNIDQYNNILRGSIEAGEKKEDENGAPLQPLPYIMVVIDELADLMLVSSSEVEDSITRLAQMARAVGIHLVLATQRPSVDVITGIIKANFPSRISFRVPTRVDSRTILDSNGAQQLLGKGDMLFLPPGSARLQRLHGPFVSEAEVGRLVSFWKKMGKAEYNPVILESQEEGTALGDFEKDELYDKAARLVVETGYASVSHLQRKMRLGYSRAARIVDMLESEGIVGPPDGSKPREVLVGKDYFDEVDRQLR
jgi:S-DNA-T family DNA segregation ATPase FtsK/SpoIIIE